MIIVDEYAEPEHEGWDLSDDSVRAIYADYLEERGDSRYELLRHSIMRRKSSNPLAHDLLLKELELIRLTKNPVPPAPDDLRIMRTDRARYVKDGHTIKGPVTTVYTRHVYFGVRLVDGLVYGKVRLKLAKADNRRWPLNAWQYTSMIQNGELRWCSNYFCCNLTDRAEGPCRGCRP